MLAPHAAWYGARCTGLDALVVVDEGQRVLAPPAQVSGIATLPLQGWRSVSVWWPPSALVLYTASGAPAFLRDGTGQRRWHGKNLNTLSTEMEALIEAEHHACTHADVGQA